MSWLASAFREAIWDADEGEDSEEEDAEDDDEGEGQGREESEDEVVKGRVERRKGGREEDANDSDAIPGDGSAAEGGDESYEEVTDELGDGTAPAGRLGQVLAFGLQRITSLLQASDSESDYEGSESDIVEEEEEGDADEAIEAQPSAVERKSTKEAAQRGIDIATGRSKRAENDGIGASSLPSVSRKEEIGWKQESSRASNVSATRRPDGERPIGAAIVDTEDGREGAERRQLPKVESIDGERPKESNEEIDFNASTSRDAHDSTAEGAESSSRNGVNEIEAGDKILGRVKNDLDELRGTLAQGFSRIRQHLPIPKIGLLHAGDDDKARGMGGWKGRADIAALGSLPPLSPMTAVQKAEEITSEQAEAAVTAKEAEATKAAAAAASAAAAAAAAAKVRAETATASAHQSSTSSTRSRQAKPSDKGATGKQADLLGTVDNSKSGQPEREAPAEEQRAVGDPKNDVKPLVGKLRAQFEGKNEPSSAAPPAKLGRSTTRELGVRAVGGSDDADDKVRSASAKDIRSSPRPEGESGSGRGSQSFRLGPFRTQQIVIGPSLLGVDAEKRKASEKLEAELEHADTEVAETGDLDTEDAQVEGTAEADAEQGEEQIVKGEDRKKGTVVDDAPKLQNFKLSRRLTDLAVTVMNMASPPPNVPAGVESTASAPPPKSGAIQEAGKDGRSRPHQQNPRTSPDNLRNSGEREPDGSSLALSVSPAVLAAEAVVQAAAKAESDASARQGTDPKSLTQSALRNSLQDVIGEEISKIQTAANLSLSTRELAITLSRLPACWLDYPFDPSVPPFKFSPAQHVHAVALEVMVPSIAALRGELCPTFMDEASFWRVYFVLHTRWLPQEDSVHSLQIKDEIERIGDRWIGKQLDLIQKTEATPPMSNTDFNIPDASPTSEELYHAMEGLEDMFQQEGSLGRRRMKAGFSVDEDDVLHGDPRLRDDVLHGDPRLRYDRPQGWVSIKSPKVGGSNATLSEEDESVTEESDESAAEGGGGWFKVEGEPPHGGLSPL